MPTTIQAALLGVVQGLTEFLPVSSSAHLILARAFFAFDGEKFGLSFDVACHVGTLVAVVIYFRREIARMVAALPRLFHPGPAREGRGDGTHPAEAGSHEEPQAGSHDEQGQYARLIWLLVIRTIPAIVAGGAVNHAVEGRLRPPPGAA